MKSSTDVGQCRLTRCQPSDDTRSSDAGVHDGNNVAELALECGEEICAALDCS